MSDSNDWKSTGLLRGSLRVLVASDWGDEVDLARATQLVPAEPQELNRRPRTPKSIAFRIAPLRIPLPPVEVELAEMGRTSLEPELTVFDFGAISLSLRTSFELSPLALLRLARSLSDSTALVERARAAAGPYFERLRPAIASPRASDLTEEYFVFRLEPASVPAPADLLAQHPDWLAGLIRLEDGPLSAEEVADALRHRISYAPTDLVVMEWAAALVIDRDCDETLQTLEFANVQLLEYRHMDRRIDEVLATAYQSIHPLVRQRLPLWRTHARPLRMLGDLRIEMDVLFERTTSALKLVGDQYVARLYRLLGARFHLDEWSASIRESLGVAQGVYQILSEQASTYRVEFLEIIVIVLILVEIVMSWVGGR